VHQAHTGRGIHADSLKFHPDPPSPTLIRPAGGLQLSSSPLDTPSRTGLQCMFRSLMMFQCLMLQAHLRSNHVTKMIARMKDLSTSIGRGVSCPKGVGNGCRPPALRAGHPRNGCKAVLVATRPQGIERLGMAGPGDTLGSPRPTLAIRPG
jgi:hypothetical protein